jgi:hypothetical protein
MSAVECGENRVSRYACPAECPHNPWALQAYDQELAIENAFMLRLGRYAQTDPLTRDLPVVSDPADIAAQDVNLRAWLFQRDDEGRTLLARWERGGFGGLNNDQRVWAGCFARMRLMVIETLDHVSRDAVRVQDRLDLAAPPIVVQDRSLARQVARFSRMLVWMIPLPHYWRITAFAVSLAEVGSLEAEEVAGAVSEHLGGPASGEPLRAWLQQNCVTACEAFYAIQEAFRRKAFEGVTTTEVYYGLNGSVQQFIDAMAQVAEAVADGPGAMERGAGMTHAWAWLDTDGDAQQEACSGGRPMLGRVLLGEGKVRLESGDTERARRLREGFEQQVGGQVIFEDLHVKEVGREWIRRDGREYNPSLVPPRLLEHAPRLATAVHMVDNAQKAIAVFKREEELCWLDQSLPFLDGKTPRQASGDPALRARLVVLVKERIRRADRAGLDRKGYSDQGWLAEELGLSELCLPVPPHLAELAAETADDAAGPDWEDEADWEDGSAADEVEASRLGEEAARQELVRRFQGECPALAEWVADNISMVMEDYEYDFVMAVIAMAWVQVSSTADAAIEPDMNALDGAAKAMLLSVQADKGVFQSLLPSKRDDEMVDVLGTILLVYCDSNPKPVARPISKAAALFGLVLLRVIVQELRRDARQPRPA